MAEKINGIVLNIRKYNDRNSIITIYTRERGRLSLISTIGIGKASNARRARLQPLGVINADINYRENSELQRLGRFNTTEVWSDLYFHPSKRAITLFLSEFLYKLLNAEMPDPGLFDFLLDSLRRLDMMKQGVADFHIPFLVSLLPFAGIQPDISGYKQGLVFDFPSGSFVERYDAKAPYLDGEEAKQVPLIAKINFTNIKSLRLSSMNRRQILYGLLNYYSFHFPGLGNLKSPEVLREIFE